MTLSDSAIKGDLFTIQIKISENPKLIHSKDENGRLPIHWASSGGHQHVVEFLLKKESPLDIPDDSGWTPLIIASSAGHLKVVELLLSHGVNVDACTVGGHSALQYAASRNNPEILELLLCSHADPNIKDERGATPLHRAASRGNFKCVEILLRYSNKFDLNSRDCDGNTVLHLACEENRCEVAKLLAKAGVEIGIVNKEERTALELATKSLATVLQRLVDTSSN